MRYVILACTQEERESYSNYGPTGLEPDQIATTPLVHDSRSAVVMLVCWCEEWRIAWNLSVCDAQRWGADRNLI